MYDILCCDTSYALFQMFIVLNVEKFLAFICIRLHGHRCSKKNSYVHLKFWCFSTERRFLVLISHCFDLQIIKFNTLMNINGIQAIYV